MKFKLLRGFLIVIPVTVNGAGPYEFLLDTGTNTTLIQTELARASRLRPIDRIELVTVAGPELSLAIQLLDQLPGAADRI